MSIHQTDEIIVQSEPQAMQDQDQDILNGSSILSAVKSRTRNERRDTSSSSNNILDSQSKHDNGRQIKGKNIDNVNAGGDDEEDEDEEEGNEDSENDNDDDQYEDADDEGINKSNRESYKQRYLTAWELDTRLNGWLSPCLTDEFSAFCRICECKLLAHKKGLIVHASSNKHKKRLLSNNSSNDLAASNSSNAQDFETENDEEYMRKLKKRKLRQEMNTFNDKWLFDPLFSAWIRKIPHDTSKALCLVCRCIITAGRSELKKHTRSKKHKKAIVNGPFEEFDELQLMRIHPFSGDKSTSQMINSSLNADLTPLKIPSVSYNQQSTVAIRHSLVTLPGMLLDAVIRKLGEYVPLALAESWDNVGVITRPLCNITVYHILLTNDLNEKIVQEAIDKKVQLIISYHPPIFSAIKKLDPSIWKDRAILMCIENKIAVYSPHTALDAIKGGINDWLISPFLINSDDTVQPINYSTDKKYNSCLEVLVSGDDQDEIKKEFDSMNNVTMTEYGNSTNICAPCSKQSLLDIVERLSQKSRDSTPIYSKVLQLVAPPMPGIGLGRIATLSAPLPLYEVVQRTKSHLDLPLLRLGLSPKHTRDTRIKTIACCAGSGHSVLKGCKVDIWITGEMSHHEVLDAVHNGISVILCDHSNTERGFFRDWSSQLKNIIFENNVDIMISELDRDPLKII